MIGLQFLKATVSKEGEENHFKMWRPTIKNEVTGGAIRLGLKYNNKGKALREAQRLLQEFRRNAS